MKLLITTQAIDLDDPIMGFFCRWVEEFSKHCASVHVICLKEGRRSLPANVQVHSLGKEQKLEASSSKLAARLAYAWRFY
ncbi:MAG: hypothetical protein NUV88_00330, partial [Candidatus Kaiserbacteria bacterium]|nr:hypothetical protein [Candidatus Kaiserbacteria bacterium]